ncbi:MAG TPA: F0F1 ATP synthase subunit B [Steroidobacteraceae bacterium]
MNINLTLFVQMVVFVVLVWFTMKFVWPMILGPMDERSRKIAAGLAAGEKGQQELSQARERADTIVREARALAHQMDEQAQRRSTETVEAAKEAARNESARLLAAAQAEVSNETVRASEQLRRQFGSMVVQAASRLVEHEVDAGTHAKLLQQLTDDIARG